ncbi:MAG: SMC-Scp complex subunit ScpB [Anaerolineaceae bacterium 4572_32.2]|nr:MAG: SMC-Scp complex subunit ScpB [Anaerolineaceae bacterium 4572_32.2]
MDYNTNDGDVKEKTTPEKGILSIAARVESLLFVADAPVSTDRLARALEATEGQVEGALSELETAYAERGLHLQRIGNHLQLTTVPEAAPYIERFMGLEARTTLSRAALEALGIIAYRQPITRPEVDAIRGVNSDSVLRTLLRAGVIEEVGRAPTVGRPILYGTTFEFLQHFGLRGLNELPPLDTLPGEDEKEA